MTRATHASSTAGSHGTAVLPVGGENDVAVDKLVRGVREFVTRNENQLTSFKMLADLVRVER